MRVLLPLFVVSAAGCDAIFDLEHVEPPPDAPACPDAIGHDEDSDGLDDRCDPCPFDARNDGDDDGDGIALACDPDPQTANEVLVFSGFDPVTRGAFEVLEGSFVADSFRAPGNGTTALLWGTAVDRVWVIAGARVDKLAATQYREIGVVFDAQLTTNPQPDGTYCVLGRNGTSDYIELFARTRPAPDVPVNSSASTLSIVGFIGTIRASTARTEVPATSCTFVTPEMEPTVSGTRTPMPPSGKLGLVMSNIEGAIEYVFIVRRP